MISRSVVIRKAVPPDLPGLIAIVTACFSIPWQDASLRHDLENNPAARMLVAVAQDQQLLGYAAYWAVFDEAQVNNIAVLPACRRQGIGRLLLAGLIDWAVKDRLRQMVLEVRSSNQAAIRLYDSCGFQSVGFRRGYYADNGEDAIIMLKNISELA
jgi:ribosomal-protein-alanine N-acetyltransferase